MMFWQNSFFYEMYRNSKNQIDTNLTYIGFYKDLKI